MIKYKSHRLLLLAEVAQMLLDVFTAKFAISCHRVRHGWCITDNTIYYFMENTKGGKCVTV